MANGANAVFTQMAVSEDNFDAVEHFKAGESMAAASNLNEKDSLYGSSEDPGDEKGAADHTTAATNKATMAALIQSNNQNHRIDESKHHLDFFLIFLPWSWFD